MTSEPEETAGEYVWARPTPALRAYAARYSGYRQVGLPGGTHRGLPSPWLTLILALDQPLVMVAHPGRRQPPGRYDALLGGLHLEPALISMEGAQSGVQVAVHPLGCRALFGLPAGELAGVDADLAAVVGAPLVAELRERLLAAAGWPARFAVLDEVFTRRLREQAVHPALEWSFGRLLRSGGAAPVAELAGEVGWSARHLTDRFRAEVGLRPKEAARVTRFDRARRLLRPGARLADIAATTGYFDQAHLAREFRALAGCSPSRWLADEFGFVQAQAAAGDEDRRHD
jgi:AraC-like DNA-binding protein